jgi:hypothetical protein
MAMMKARKPKRYAGGGSIDRANDATMVKDPHGIFRGIEKATDMVVPGGFSRVFRMTTYKDEDAVKREAEAAAMQTPEAAAQQQGNMKRGGAVKEVKSGSKPKKPLYERPRPANMKSKTMTPTQKAAASKIAKASGDKKVGLFARINAMKKVK